METIIEKTEEFLPYWPLFVMFISTTIVAQILKHKVLTLEIAAKNKVVYWLRRLFPILLLATGFFTGFFWPGELIPSLVEKIHKAFAMMGASGASIIGWNVFKNYIKTKYKVDIVTLSDE